MYDYKRNFCPQCMVMSELIFRCSTANPIGLAFLMGQFCDFNREWYLSGGIVASSTVKIGVWRGWGPFSCRKCS